MASLQLIGAVDMVSLLRARVRACSPQRPLCLEAGVRRCNSRWSGFLLLTTTKASSVYLSAVDPVELVFLRWYGAGLIKVRKSSIPEQTACG